MFPGLGWHNGLPADVGGGPTDAEDMWLAMRRAVGGGVEDGSGTGAGPIDGIEDLWRQCKAVALVNSAASEDRAAIQIHPGLSTDLLPVYERQLAIFEGDTETERREAVEAAWIRALSAVIPALTSELARISPALSIQTVDNNQATVVQFGKQFGPRTGGPAFGSGVTASVESSAWPNYSTHFVLLVRYTLPVGQLQIPTTIRESVKRMLNEALPAWVDWFIFTSTPFYLDGGVDGSSLLDQTAFG